MPEGTVREPLIASPIELRSVTARNRVVISPMCQYSATDGIVNDWHVVHLGRFAMGGAGIVFVEATAIAEEGRITHGDLGLWHDGQIDGVRRLVKIIEQFGAVPAIQLGHAGRKASSSRPWDGGQAVRSGNARDEEPWPTVSASPLPTGDDWPVPRELDRDDIARLVQSWKEAAGRALDAGMRIAELHFAHGYLIHQFLSPLSNHRQDAYGGDIEGRSRFALEVAEAVRTVWPEELPLFARLSTTDWVDGGWTAEDSVWLSSRLKERGVDVIDCSSGGMTATSGTAALVPRAPGYQIPMSEKIRKEAGIRTMGVGLIFDGTQAEEILREGRADLIAVAREALSDPNWALHAIQQAKGHPEFSHWPDQSGWWLDRRQRALSL